MGSAKLRAETGSQDVGQHSELGVPAVGLVCFTRPFFTIDAGATFAGSWVMYFHILEKCMYLIRVTVSLKKILLPIL